MYLSSQHELSASLRRNKMENKSFSKKRKSRSRCMSRERRFDIIIISFGVQIQFRSRCSLRRADSLLSAWPPPFNLPDGLKSNSSRPAFSMAAAVAASVASHAPPLTLSSGARRPPRPSSPFLITFGKDFYPLLYIRNGPFRQRRYPKPSRQVLWCKKRVRYISNKAITRRHRI